MSMNWRDSHQFFFHIEFSSNRRNFYRISHAFKFHSFQRRFAPFQVQYNSNFQSFSSSSPFSSVSVQNIQPELQCQTCYITALPRAPPVAKREWSHPVLARVLLVIPLIGFLRLSSSTFPATWCLSLIIAVMMWFIASLEFVELPAHPTRSAVQSTPRGHTVRGNEISPHRQHCAGCCLTVTSRCGGVPINHR